jgi:hypothetical protein
MRDTRLFADRRRGCDRRERPRRHLIHSAAAERRRVVDRRRGAERRSTLDRRNRAGRAIAAEAPGEHVRNALQLLGALAADAGLDLEARADLTAVLERLRRALTLLEHRAS